MQKFGHPAAVQMSDGAGGARSLLLYKVMASPSLFFFYFFFLNFIKSKPLGDFI